MTFMLGIGNLPMLTAWLMVTLLSSQILAASVNLSTGTICAAHSELSTGLFTPSSCRPSNPASVFARKESGTRRGLW